MSPVTQTKSTYNTPITPRKAKIHSEKKYYHYCNRVINIPGSFTESKIVPVREREKNTLINSNKIPIP